MTVNQHGWIILPLILMHGHAFSPFVIIHDLLSVFSLSLRRLHVTLCLWPLALATATSSKLAAGSHAG